MSDKTNELFVCWKGFGYLYHKTLLTTAKEAFSEFQTKVETLRINVDNLPTPDRVELRSHCGVVIDKI